MSCFVKCMFGLSAFMSERDEKTRCDIIVGVRGVIERWWWSFFMCVLDDGLTR